MINLVRMEEQIELHEGFKTTLYLDTATPPRWTGGFGYNVTDRGLTPLIAAIGRTITMEQLKASGLSKDEWRKVLRADLKHFEQRAIARFPLYPRLDEVRQRVVVDLAYNIGTKALGFISAIGAVTAALQQTDPRLKQLCWDASCFHLMDSLWSTQVDDGLGGRYGRADRLCGMLRTGKDFTK